MQISYWGVVSICLQAFSSDITMSFTQSICYSKFTKEIMRNMRGRLKDVAADKSPPFDHLYLEIVE